MSEQTLYDRLGHREGIRAVVDEFYHRLVDDDQLGTYFADADIEHLRRTQTDFLCAAAGGPESYEGTPVREAHLHVPFTAADIDRAVELLEGGLDEFDINEADKQAVIGAVAQFERELRAPHD
jgi:hemoglobin